MEMRKIRFNMKNTFLQTMDDLGHELWLIETSDMTMMQKENAKRELSGLPTLTEKEFEEQLKQYQ